MPQSQEEFYFALPYDKMDLVLCGYNQGATAAEEAKAAGLTEAQAQHAMKDAETKRSTKRDLAGRLGYWSDRILGSILSDGPSFEMMICGRKA